MQTLADQVAAEWSAIDPAARSVCIQCGKQFPIVRTGVVTTWEQSIVCPYCGFVPSDACCRSILDELAKRRSSAAPPAAPEPAKEEESARDDPPGLDDVIGNAPAVLQIRTALDAHRARLAQVDGRTVAARAHVFPHTIFSGSGGIGKTMLAEIIAREVKRPLKLQMGQSLNSPAKVAAMLLSLKAGDILFIDELQGLRGDAQQTLYRAMEDGLLVPITKTGQPPAAPIHLPPFTLIGATTDAWALLNSFLQRFKYRIGMERLTAAELAQAISERARRRGWSLTSEAAGMIADRSHGTPRLALGLLDGCMDTALAGGESAIDGMVVDATCQIWRLDGLGLDNIARKYLGYLAEANAPVRLNVLATRLDGLSRRTVEIRVEPDLVWLGLVEKCDTGRRLTAAGREHLKGKP